jgi:hypothetical protein
MPLLSLPWHLFLTLLPEFEAPNSKSALTVSLHDVNSRSRGLFTSLRFCLNRFTTWCTTFKHWCSLICTIYSPSQKCCSVQVSGSTFPSPTCTCTICTAKAMLRLGFSCTHLILNCTHSVIIFLKNILLDKNRKFRKIIDHTWKKGTLSWRKSHTALLTVSY